VRVHVTLAKAKNEIGRLGYGYGCERDKRAEQRERQRGEKEYRVCHVMVGVMEHRCCCCFVARGEAKHHQIICLWCSQFMYR
jgi:hypothetical protein